MNAKYYGRGGGGGELVEYQPKIGTFTAWFVVVVAMSDFIYLCAQITVLK